MKRREWRALSDLVMGRDPEPAWWAARQIVMAAERVLFAAFTVYITFCVAKLLLRVAWPQCP